MEYKIQRFPWFDTIPASDCIWKYKRAIEGHKFILVDVEFMIEDLVVEGEQIGQIYEGKVYSHWGSFPNIFDQSTLRIATLQRYNPTQLLPLNQYEVKEFTMSWRNTHNASVRVCTIVYFYEVPMTKLELLEYAVKQPRYKYRHGSARTLDRFED